MIETTIIANLMFDRDYYGKVFPYIKEEYFDDMHIRKIFATYSDYVNTYQEPPSIEALTLSIDKRKDLNEDAFKGIVTVLKELKIDQATNKEFLINETEKFCQDKDLYNSIRKAILILDGQDKNLDKGSIPKLLSDSLGVSFDTHIGHDLLEDFESRFEYYHKKEERLEFDIDLLNKITKGGLPKKSLSCILAETGAGKSLFMCHMAAANLLHGKNVLYITLEMAEERISERIDANILDITIDDLNDIPKETYVKRINRFKDKTTGKLIVKEFPTGSAHAGHIRHLLNELRLKKNFTPDIIYLDYLNLCSSSRVKNSNANSYTIVKSIAEEIRGLAMEFNIPICTATQANRSGFGNSDLDTTNTSESIGLPATLDFYFAIIVSEELETMGQIMVKQLKNRWGDINYYKRFVVGIDRAKMKLYNLEDGAQKNIQTESQKQSDKPVFDKSNFTDTKKKKKSFDVGDLT